MVQVWPLQCTRSKKVLWFFPSGREAPPNGSPCPAEEWMLCLFVSFLADSIQHSSIKVALFTCTKQGFPDPLLNCLHLQRVLRGITQGSPAAHQLPVMDSIMDIIYLVLDLSIHDHCTLQSSQCQTWLPFPLPSIWRLADIAVDSMVSLSCLQVCIKVSKTDPFCIGCFIHEGLGRAPMCSLQAMLAYLALGGNGPGPLFWSTVANHWLTCFWLTGSGRFSQWQGLLAISPVIAFESVQPMLQFTTVSLTILSKHSGVGQATPISCISGLCLKLWPACQVNWPISSLSDCLGSGRLVVTQMIG